MSVPSCAATAGALGIWHVLLTMHVGLGRVKYRTALGDGGHEELAHRMRMQSNLTESAPLFLVLLGLLEMSAAWPRLVLILGPTMVLVRIVHTFGLSMRFSTGANSFRAIGFVGTVLVMLIVSVACLLVALPRFR